MPAHIVILIIVVVLLILIVSNLKIVPQAYVFVVERLGAYHATWDTGIHVLIPFIDRVSKKVNLKELVADFPPQAVITKDNVTMQIDTVIYLQMTSSIPRCAPFWMKPPILGALRSTVWN